MKTLQQIKQATEKGDYTTVAKMVAVSPDLVKKVIAGTRTDHYNIQRTFSELIESRERMFKRAKRRMAA